MRLPRVQFSVKQIMVLVAIVALVLGVQTTRRRWADCKRQAAYHADCAQFFTLMAELRFAELPRVAFRADAEREFGVLSGKLTRPREWAETCRSYGAEHRAQAVYWGSRW